MFARGSWLLINFAFAPTVAHLAGWSPCNTTQVSFWQNECRDQTCPAGDDGGSLASVFPVDESETQRAVEGEDDSDETQSLFWFVVLAAALLIAAMLSWCAFCLCCGVSERVRVVFWLG